MSAADGSILEIGALVQIHASSDGDKKGGKVVEKTRGWYHVLIDGEEEAKNFRRSELVAVDDDQLEQQHEEEEEEEEEREKKKAMVAPTSARATSKKVQQEAIDGDDEEENDDDNDQEEEEEEEEIIPLGEDPLEKKKNKVFGSAKRMANMTLETGLPTPSYFRFDQLRRGKGEGEGSNQHQRHQQQYKAKRAILDTTSLASTTKSLLTAAAALSHPKKDPAGERQVKATYERNREHELDAKMLLMRNYIDPKRFYKNLDGLAKGYQIGTVIEGPADYRGGRLPKRERKKTFVDEILADQAIRGYSKRKFNELQAAAQSNKKGSYKAKQMKKKPKWAKR